MVDLRGKDSISNYYEVYNYIGVYEKPISEKDTKNQEFSTVIFSPYSQTTYRP